MLARAGGYRTCALNRSNAEMSVEKRPIREGMPILLYLANRTSTIESCSVGNSHTQSNWFAVSTTPRHEKRVAQHFGLREVECFLPLYRSQRRWNDGSKVALDLPLFPGYIFVRIGRKERTRVLQVPGVLALVAGTGREVRQRIRPSPNMGGTKPPIPPTCH